MKEFKIDNKGSQQLFSNKILERLTRTHFAFPVILYFLIGSTSIIYSAWSPEISLRNFWWLLPCGILSFTLVEYLIHRFFFHFDAKTEKEQALQYQIHGVHHHFPRDKDRLVMPPVLSIILAGLFFLLFRILMGDLGILFFGGFVIGYSTYLCIHYMVHAMKPPANFLKIFWTHHSLHHYHSVDTAFSVSFPFWDYLFGTMPDRTPAEKK